jgi:5-methylcytosine-specific restriction endonuclease McrA
MSGDPYPKDAQLSRGARRYKRKVASPKQWQAIIAAKTGPCRVCEARWGVSALPRYGVEYHHLVSRQDGGDDVGDNIVPLCSFCHDDVTRRYSGSCGALIGTLSDAEYAYMVERGGEDYPVRAYGIEYQR